VCSWLTMPAKTKKFEFLEHTADVKFRAYGKNLEEAFENAALATFEIMTPIKKVKPKQKKTIKVEAKKKRSLLYDFLEELIVLTDTEGFLLSKVKSLKITERKGSNGQNNKGNDEESKKGKAPLFQLKAVVVGDAGGQYDVSTYIKAVTYSDMFIKEEPGKVVIQVVHDI
jgi:SHS2 domain-containing protein